MTDPAPAPLVRQAAAAVHGRFVVRPAAEGNTAHWLVGFHGQAQSAEEFMSSLEMVRPGRAWLVASVQGLHRHYTRGGRIVATWMTSQDRERAIADNVAWVNAALDAIAAEFGPPRAIVYAGFSQGVAMAYRAARLGSREAAAIVAAGGDVPAELLSPGGRAWPSVLAMTGAADTWYTPERLEADAGRMRALGVEVRTLVHAGAHEWNDAVAAEAAELLRGIEAPGFR